ncbi:O-antigen polymerase [Kocuria flava]|uniref:O-antigen polymerase n=1 Tax=Kocuria flava TaxID=446860 RepID=UPI001181657A|nr:O-antigen polymerase [Kocuria flava]
MACADETAEAQDFEKNRRALLIHWPWWLHPVWALLLMVAGTAAVAIMLPAQYYAVWGTVKFIDAHDSIKMLLGISLVLVGISLANFGIPRVKVSHIEVGPAREEFLRKSYRFLFTLTVCGYIFWILIAISEGVNLASLASVIQRDEGAIGELKENSRPVGGLTTLTQFGPVAVAVGFIRRKIGTGGRSYWLLIALALLRTVFYAERLALLEVLFPIILISTLTMRKRTVWRPVAQLAPLLAGPLVWVIFALSEYSRSWVYYQSTVSMPFAEWVTSRLLGYYTTSYNNSALFADAWQGTYGAPYVSIQALWNAPGAGLVLGAPTTMGVHPESWWSSVLATQSNPEFTNTGSFLVSFAELGWFGAVIFWTLIGYGVGLLYVSVARGNLVGVIAYCTLFIGLLELPRFMYWTQGRAVPLLLALAIMAWVYARLKSPRINNTTEPKERESPWSGLAQRQG